MLVDEPIPFASIRFEVSPLLPFCRAFSSPISDMVEELYQKGSQSLTGLADMCSCAFRFPRPLSPSLFLAHVFVCLFFNINICTPVDGDSIYTNTRLPLRSFSPSGSFGSQIKRKNA